MNSTQVGDIKIDTPGRSKPVPVPTTLTFVDFKYNYDLNQFCLSNQIFETIILKKLIYI